MKPAFIKLLINGIEFQIPWGWIGRWGVWPYFYKTPRHDNDNRRWV